MKIKGSVVIIYLILCIPAYSGTIKCVNEKGSVAFTDSQCPSGYRSQNIIVYDNGVSTGRSAVNGSGQSTNTEYRGSYNSSNSSYAQCLSSEKSKSLKKMAQDPMTMNLSLKLAQYEAEEACASKLGERNPKRIGSKYYSNYEECLATERNKFISKSSPDPMMIKLTFKLAKQQAESVCAPMAR